MNFSGEFGSSYDAFDGGIPAMFLVGGPVAGALVASSAGVPDGQTWVMLGADWSGAVGVGHFLWGSAFSPAGTNLQMAETPGGAHSGWASGFWRGYLAFQPGEAMKVTAQSDNLGSSSLFVCAWGLVLPYTAA